MYANANRTKPQALALPFCAGEKVLHSIKQLSFKCGCICAAVTVGSARVTAQKARFGKGGEHISYQTASRILLFFGGKLERWNHLS